MSKGEEMHCLTSQRVKLFSCSLLVVCILIFMSGKSGADIVSHTFTITSGIAHTSGGIHGGGLGDLPVSGNFKLDIDTVSNLVLLENIDVSVDPPPMDFNWDDLAGSITGTDLYLSTPYHDPAFLRTEFRGTFDGQYLSLDGTYQEPCYDCYTYHFIIRATTVLDRDGDGIPDEADNCPSVPNLDQADLDGDDVGNVCDHDADGDGYYCPKCFETPCPLMPCMDCDDLDASVHPGAPEICDKKDNDCNGQVDESGCECFSNSDCGPENYCSKPKESCDGKGTCAVRPDACIEIYQPVCGCDDRTYGNACEAAAAGVNVVHDGACIEPECGECTSDADCSAGTRCNAADLCLVSCECPMCDVCAGHCVPVSLTCRSNADCSTGYYCAKPAGECAGAGTCQIRGDACLMYWDPVCGCDGNTYSNAGCAAVAGMSVAYRGECGQQRYYCDRDGDGHAGIVPYNCLIEPWLCDISQCQTTSGDDCDDNEPENFPGNPEVCDDAKDNDCDGYIDKEDGDCLFVLKGDINSDGNVDISDVIRVLRMALDLDADQVCADINGDGIVDISDVIRTLRMALGLDSLEDCI
jgi:hypothetical protein